MPWQQKCRYGPLCLLVPRLGATKLLEQRPGLGRELLRCMTEHALAPHVRSTCEQHVAVILALCLYIRINFNNKPSECVFVILAQLSNDPSPGYNIEQLAKK